MITEHTGYCSHCKSTVPLEIISVLRGWMCWFGKLPVK